MTNLILLVPLWAAIAVGICVWICEAAPDEPTVGRKH